MTFEQTLTIGFIILTLYLWHRCNVKQRKEMELWKRRNDFDLDDWM